MYSFIRNKVLGAAPCTSNLDLSGPTTTPKLIQQCLQILKF